MLPTISIGPLLLQMPGLALLAGGWVSLNLIERQAKELSLDVESILALVFYSLMVVILGSRLAYAVQFPAVYWENPLSLFALSTTTLAPLEGFVIGLVVAFIFGQRKGLTIRPTLDALAPGLAAFMVAWGVSHILSGDAFGVAADVPWAIYLWGGKPASGPGLRNPACPGDFHSGLEIPAGESGRRGQFPIFPLPVRPIQVVFDNVSRGQLDLI